MQISITSRRHSLSDHLREYVEKKIEKLGKYVQGAGEAHVVMERNDTGQIVEIRFHGLHKIMHVRELGDNVRGCIDKAVDKIEQQIKKQKEKLVEKRP
ncbi:MAG: ribosome-associated translation inhibitor RaiA [bacterium]|nr:ribosome-associated translation inhibitor RaiA [bacterium]